MDAEVRDDRDAVEDDDRGGRRQRVPAPVDRDVVGQRSADEARPCGRGRHGRGARVDHALDEPARGVPRARASRSRRCPRARSVRRARACTTSAPPPAGASSTSATAARIASEPSRVIASRSQVTNTARVSPSSTTRARSSRSSCTDVAGSRRSPSPARCTGRSGVITAVAKPTRGDSYCLLQDVACDLVDGPRPPRSPSTVNAGPMPTGRWCDDPRRSVHGRGRARSRPLCGSARPGSRTRPGLVHLCRRGARLGAGDEPGAPSAHPREPREARTTYTSRLRDTTGSNPSTVPITWRPAPDWRASMRATTAVAPTARARSRHDLGHAQVVAHERRATIGTTSPGTA